MTGQRHDGIGHRRLAEALERIEEIADVRREFLDVGVGRHDDDGQILGEVFARSATYRPRAAGGQARQGTAGRVQAGLDGR